MTDRYLAFKFIHPDFDSDKQRSGLVLNKDGSLATVSGGSAIRQAIFLLLSTRMGELVTRPTYGSDLHLLLFSPNDDTTAGLAIHYVRRALEKWEPRIEILSLDAGPSVKDRGKLFIDIEYRERSTQVDERLLLTLDLMEGDA